MDNFIHFSINTVLYIYKKVTVAFVSTLKELPLTFKNTPGSNCIEPI